MGYHHLSGVSAPAELTKILPADQEFAHLTKYLGLSSSPRLLLDSPFTLVLVRRWMSHPDLRLGQDYGYTAQVPQLIPLPQDYSNLINSISSFTCPRSIGEESKTPSMCLVCGTVVCSHSYCSRLNWMVRAWVPVLPTPTGVEQALASSSEFGSVRL